MTLRAETDQRESANHVVLWVFRRNRREMLAACNRGEGSSEFLYGMLSLMDRYETRFVEDEGFNPIFYIWNPIERVIGYLTQMGFALHMALKSLDQLRSAEVIISTVDACGLPIALLKRVKLIRGKLIYISQGLSDRMHSYGRGRLLPNAYRRLLAEADRLVTLNTGSQIGLAQWLGIPKESVVVLPFGVDCQFWHNTSNGLSQSDRIVSVGSDAGRDYAVLLRACEDLPLHVVTRQPLPDGDNVAVTTNHSAVELRSIYSACRFVVVPLKNIDQPSGQSTALQAMACSKAVVMTQTRGHWGGALLQSGENCLLVPPGDTEALREAAHHLWSNPQECERLGANARETVQSFFGEQHMAGMLSELIDDAMKDQEALTSCR